MRTMNTKLGWLTATAMFLGIGCGEESVEEPAASVEPTGGRWSTGGRSSTGGMAPVSEVAPANDAGAGGMPGPGQAAGAGAGGDIDQYCGDGRVEGWEECDDGNMSNDDFCLIACRNARCGDGYVQPGEECDPGNPRQPPCEADCTLSSVCGDGIIQAAEACDDGDGNQNNDCLNDCTLPACGDGFVHNLGSGREICDDGEDNGWFPATCSPECTIDHSCRDGEWQPERGEECDDDSKDDTASCKLDCTLNVCGDGYAYLSETPGTNNTSSPHDCDDANEDDADACTSDCAWNVCGDGFVFSKGYGAQYEDAEDGNELDDNPNPTEECDDGNDEAGDGCFECQLEE
jgi:cysteine-rich repeat protein